MGAAQLPFAFQHFLPRNAFPSPIQQCQSSVDAPTTVAIESPFHAQEQSWALAHSQSSCLWRWAGAQGWRTDTNM